MKPPTIKTETECVQPQEEDEFDGWDFVDEGEEVRSSWFTPFDNNIESDETSSLLIGGEYLLRVWFVGTVLLQSLAL